MARGQTCRRRFPLLQGLGILAFALLAAGEFFRSGGVGLLTWVGAGAYVVLAAASLFSLSAGKRARTEGEQIVGRYGVSMPEEVAALAQNYQERAARVDQAAQQVRLVREGLSDRQARRENSRKDLFAFVHSFAPEVKDLFGCSAALSRALNLGEREAVAHAKLEGGPAAVRRPQDPGWTAGRPRGPGTGSPPAHHGGDRRPAGHRPGRPGAHRAGPEHGSGEAEGGGRPRRPGCPPGGAGGGAGAAQPGASGHLHRPDRPEGGQRPAPGAVLPRAQPPGGTVSGPAHRGEVHQPLPEPGAGGLRRRGRGCAPPPVPVFVQGDGGPGVSGGAPGGVRPVPAGAPGPPGAGRRPGRFRPGAHGAGPGPAGGALPGGADPLFHLPEPGGDLSVQNSRRPPRSPLP